VSEQPNDETAQDVVPDAEAAYAPVQPPSAPDSDWEPAGATWAEELTGGETAQAAPVDSIFRDDTGQTVPMGMAYPPEASEEQAKLAAERAARREARNQALTATAPVVEAKPAPVVVTKRTNDKFFPSFGLFCLRVVVAGILTLRGLWVVTHLADTERVITEHTILPEPKLMTMVLGGALLACALLMLLGLLTRVAGLLVAAIGIGADVLYWWGPGFSVLTDQGILGELELLGGVVGLLFLFVGAGGWSLDHAVRSSWRKDRAETA
jgi:uncharacterized membrane protein YphA (DoxX/SURF4 family)